MSEQLLHQILQKLDHIEVEQASMKTDMQTMKTDMQTMKTDMQTMKSDIEIMKSDMGTVKSDILDLKESQGLMQIQLNETNVIVRAIRDRQEETDAKLDALSMDVHKLHGEVASIKEGQERHEKILEKLSLRSIEQEADIHELKLAK
ncbi:hypothetical protein [Paenibacillus sp. DYY-L-2]|uniref:hypothetical protein n=1 Tax=Paenibacillus sp. DYY-L-2 TaxID=3447013 RepID=UPI003F4FF05C